METILNTFREIGFKKVVISFDLDNNMFKFDIKDFEDNDVFHQDHAGLKEAYSQMMTGLGSAINKLENLNKG